MRATRIGATAAGLLATPGVAGQVLAVVSRAAYLRCDDGEVLWLGDERLPAHGRSLLLPYSPGRLPTRASWSAQAGLLVVPGSLAVDLSGAERWSLPPIDRRHLPPASALAARAAAALAAADLVAPSDGLGPLLPLVLSRWGGRSRQSEVQPRGPLAALALETVAAVAQACRRRDVWAVARAAERLVGLGPGLTPSGDDFVGGLLFALHHLRVLYPGSFAWADEPLRALLASAGARTNPISYVLLADLAAGAGPAPLHDLLLGLLQMSEPCQAVPALRRLVDVGHTSGWDVLLGLLCALLALDTPTVAS